MKYKNNVKKIDVIKKFLKNKLYLRIELKKQWLY